MKRISKKLLSWLLVVCMVMSMVPTMVLPVSAIDTPSAKELYNTSETWNEAALANKLKATFGVSGNQVVRISGGFLENRTVSSLNLTASVTLEDDTTYTVQKKPLYGGSWTNVGSFVFHLITATLNDTDIDMIDVQVMNKDAIEAAIKANLDTDDVVPADLLDGVDLDAATVQYKAGNNDLTWHEVNFVPSTLLDIGQHAFGQANGDLAIGNTELVRVTFTSENYGSVSVQGLVTIVDNRTPTTIQVLNRHGLVGNLLDQFTDTDLVITYGDDLTAAILQRIAIAADDSVAIIPTTENVTIKPTSLNVQLTAAQDVKVTFLGNETYAPSTITVKVFVLPAPSSLNVKSETFVYDGQSHALEVTAKPETLDYITVIAGIDGDAAGYISIDIPASLQDSMKLELPLLPDIDIYQILKTSIGDGVSLLSLADILNNINGILSQPIPGTDQTVGELMGMSTEALTQIITVIEAAVEVLPDNIALNITLGNTAKNAGIYTVTAISTDLNYVPALNSGVMTILPQTEDVAIFFNENITAPMTVFEAADFDFSAVLMSNGELVDGKHLVHGFTGVNYQGKPMASSDPIREAGIYTQTVGTIGGNYLAKPIARSYVVKRVSTTITGADVSVTYDHEAHGVDFTVTADNGDDLTADATITYVGIGNDYNSTEAPVNAGTYAASISYAGNGSYTPANKVYTVTIAPAGTTLTAEDVTAVYDGEGHGLDVTLMGDDGTDLTEFVNVLYIGVNTHYVSTEAPVNAGVYKARVTFTGNGNYIPVDEWFTVTITPALAEVTAKSTTSVYDGEAHPISLTVIGVNGIDMTDKAVVTYVGMDNEYNSTEAPVNVGIYTAHITLPDRNYYTVDLYRTVTITPACATVTADDVNVVYDGQPHTVALSIIGADGVDMTAQATVTYTGIGNDYNSTEAPVNVGLYRANVRFVDRNHFPVALHRFVTISPAVVTVTAENVTATYDGQAHGLDLTITGADGVDMTAQATVTYTGIGNDYNSTEAPVNVGSYTATVALEDANHYPVVKNYTITITPATVEVTAENVTATYDGQAHGIDLTITGVNGADLSADTTVTYVGVDNDYNSTEAPVNAGSYTAKVVYNNGNYAPVELTYTVTIAKRAVTITVANVSAVYGDIPSATAEPAGLTATVEGALTSEPLNVTACVVKTDSYPHVGQYDLAVEYAANPNYDVTTELGKLTISPMAVTVTVANAAKYAGDADPEFTCTVAPALPYGEELNVTLTRQAGEELGTYEISAAVSNTDYAVTVVPGTLTISPVPTYGITVNPANRGTVSADSDSAAAGETVTITATADNGYKLDTLTVVDENGQEITCTANDDGTYSFVMPAGPVSVTATFVRYNCAVDCPHDGLNCPILRFTDATPDAWYHDGVHFCLHNGIMYGIAENRFAPNSLATRAMIVTMLAATAGVDTTGGDPWYSVSRDWAVENQISDGSNMEQFITREQVVAMMYRFAILKGLDTSVAGDYSCFQDAAEVSDWAQASMSWAVGAGLIAGCNNMLHPQDNATRAEVATFFMRFVCDVLK